MRAESDQGESGLNARRAFATIAIYRIDNPLVLIGLTVTALAQGAQGCHADTGHV
jgi:hypothetical protein